MAKKIVFTDESLATFVNEIKTYTDDSVADKADSNHTHNIIVVSDTQPTNGAYLWFDTSS